MHIYPESIEYCRFSTNLKAIEYQIDPHRGCWLCTSHCKDKDGYIKIVRNRVFTRLHRYVYELEHNVSLTADQLVCHTCDTPSCFNPSHLFLGTPLDNHQDRNAKGRQARGSKNGGGNKLTEDMIPGIRADTRYLRDIALDYGVAFSIIWKIKHGILWKHIP